MKTQRHIISCMLFFLAIHYSWGQLPYFDIPGFFMRKAEDNAAKDFQKQHLKTTATYTSAAALALLEKQTRTTFSFSPVNSAVINYFDYNNICKSYLNPFRKAECTNKLNYLKYAHQTVLQFMNTPLEHQVNNGVKEQIMTKYTAITNSILKELELLKLKAEKDNVYTRLLIP